MYWLSVIPDLLGTVWREHPRDLEFVYTVMQFLFTRKKKKREKVEHNCAREESRREAEECTRDLFNGYLGHVYQASLVLDMLLR